VLSQWPLPNLGLQLRKQVRVQMLLNMLIPRADNKFLASRK